MNLVFFLSLSMLPPLPMTSVIIDPIDDALEAQGLPKKPGVLDRTIPQGRPAGAIAAILLPLPFALAFTALSVAVFRGSSWGSRSPCR
jgi:hypothetical protein